jgi:hypothetical protein
MESHYLYSGHLLHCTKFSLIFTLSLQVGMVMMHLRSKPLTSLQNRMESSSRPFERACTDATHSQFNYVRRDQYNIQNVASQQTVLDTLKPIDRSGDYVPPCVAAQLAQNGTTNVMRFPVVVLDALDLTTQRRICMDTIINWSRLHPSFKLIITSRDQLILRSLLPYTS